VQCALALHLNSEAWRCELIHYLLNFFELGAMPKRIAPYALLGKVLFRSPISATIGTSCQKVAIGYGA
jgi:hypothetical protein